VGQDIVREDLVKAYTELLSDNEAEVRTAAAGQLPGKRHDVHRSLTLELILYALQASLNSSTETSSSPVSSLVFEL
jgi:hypothetical protein